LPNLADRSVGASEPQLLPDVSGLRPATIRCVRIRRRETKHSADRRAEQKGIEYV